MPFKEGVYGTVTEAIIESALVTWFGILLYEIATFAPHGRVTVRVFPAFPAHRPDRPTPLLHPFNPHFHPPAHRF